MNQEVSRLIDGYREAYTETLRRWVRIPSVKGEAEEGAPFGREIRRMLDTAVEDARAMGFDKLAARVRQAEERAEAAEKALQEAEKRAQEKATHETSESTAKTEGAQQCAQSEAEDNDKADGGDAGAGKAGLNLMAALCGLK
jgi:hypothetical protein